MTILLVPLLSLSDKLKSGLAEAIGRAFLTRVELSEPMSGLFDDAFNKESGAYDAEKLICFLKKEFGTEDYEKIIAVGNLDLELSGENVFGAAEQNGKLSILGIYRFDPRFYSRPTDYEKILDRSVKEAIHEIGHCFGLQHCKRPVCTMHPAKNIMTIDSRERFFCEDCREKLRNQL